MTLTFYKLIRRKIFFKNLYSHDSSNWPEESNELLHITGPLWFRTAQAIVFHTCLDCLMERVEIVASINDLSAGLNFAMGCKYPNNTWYQEPTDLEKDCEQCYLKMCLRICKRLFYILDPSYMNEFTVLYYVVFLFLLMYLEWGTILKMSKGLKKN